MIAHSITGADYFSYENNMAYMSVSQFKAFENCEAAAIAEIKNEYRSERTAALLVGLYVDAHFEGTLDIFKAKNPEIFTQKGTLKAEYKQAEYIINRIERDSFFMKAMDGEKQKIMVGDIEGIPVKIKIDSYREHKTIVDLKIIKDFSPIYVNGRGRLSFYEAWGYDIQGAVYQEIVRQNTGETLPFVLAAATKEKETDLQLISLDQAELDAALEIVKANIVHYHNIKTGSVEPVRCEHCNYCKFTKVLDKVITSEEFKNDYTD
ncbi:MAG: PD-(D/E)XK nuclease-like domain-containing protein [Ruminococcus sp.]|nr:PD-(D/E)XK nuclease-like domain-containing protein [Ruminococcus sp.]